MKKILIEFTSKHEVLKTLIGIVLSIYSIGYHVSTIKKRIVNKSQIEILRQCDEKLVLIYTKESNRRVRERLKEAKDRLEIIACKSLLYNQFYGSVMVTRHSYTWADSEKLEVIQEKIKKELHIL